MTSHAHDAQPRLEFHEGTLRLRGVSAAALEKIFPRDKEIAWTADDRDACFRTDAMHYRLVRGRLIEKLSPPPIDAVGPCAAALTGRGRKITFQRRLDVRLRDDQSAAAEAWLSGGRAGVIVMPTGSGKTVVALELMRRSAGSTLVVVPIRDLMYQWHERILATTGIDAGLIGDGVHRVSPISVATYDSATIHMHRIGNRFETIIFDEVHHLAGPWRTDAARMSAAVQRLGLTATPPTQPRRRDELRRLVGPTLHEDTIVSARGKTLADYRVRRIPVRLTAAESRRYAELAAVVRHYVAERRAEDPSFRWDQIFKLAAVDPDARRCLRAFRLKSRLEDRAAGKLRVLEDLFRLHAGEPILVFVGSNAMARDISLRFLVPCLLSHCGKRERCELLGGLADGTYPVLVANRVLDEGVDLPDVKVAIVLGGTASGRQATQRLGRVLRKGCGRDAILYEVVTDKTGEVARSRTRRRNEAYRGVRKGPAS